MELFRTEEFYIFVKDQHSLWWDRQTGAFIPKTGWDLADAEDPTCVGICHGLIGKVEHPSVFDPRLIIIKECASVGKIHGDHEVFKIKSIAFLHLGAENGELNLAPCPKHKTIGQKTPKKGPSNPFMDLQKNTAFTKTLGTLKSAGNAIKSTTQQAAAMATGSPLKKDAKDKEKFEKQIVEEFYKIFTDTNSFYFSHTCDITSSLQRLCNLEKTRQIDPKAIWRSVDDRFFWNRNMLKQLINLNNPSCDPWIMPIIQGYIQIEECKVEIDQDIRGVKTSPKYEIFKLSIVSRRSRFRAGTRYKRRGVDEQGECANYVETEQLIAYQHHEVSFVQVRGSVPVYWSQPGYKYRPPPRIDKDEMETKSAFETHFKKEISRYGPICVINLVDQTGKEKVIWDAYSHHIFEFNSPHVTYVTFDFHEYCRGMHFENVSILINSIADIIKDMNYCWRDKQGHICSQLGIFRINCIDCLDRTNVVQTALAKSVMEIQFCKLGLITPEGVIPDSIKSRFQLLWANNGDTISKQYAGTNALKGDYTRTGERKFTGIMKDGMNSANRFYRNHFTDTARQCCLDLIHGSPVRVDDLQDSWSHLNTVSNIASELVPLAPPSYSAHLALEQELVNALCYMYRYYLSRFKDSTRQGTIDLMLGNYVSEEVFNESRANNFEEDSAATAEHVKLLIEDCKKMLINNPEMVLGAWGLINADPSTGDPSETEMDAILILTKDSYFVADYDDQVDKVTKYQRVGLSDVVLLESGIPEAGTSLFKTNKSHYCFRINYKVNGVVGYYHMFRSTNLQFFNNMAVFLKNEDEEIESLKAICEAFTVALDICGLPAVPYNQGQKLDRRKSKVVSDTNNSSNVYLDIVGLPHLTRNVSETQLLALKNAGTKALSNMSQQFSRLNRLGSSLKPKRRTPRFTIGRDRNKVESSSESDEDYETSIFQPDTSSDSASGLRYDTGSANIEQAVEATEDSKVTESFLPSVGIVMGAPNEQGVQETTLETKENIASPENTSMVNNEQLSSIINIISIQQNPEIQINSGSFEGSDTRLQPPNTLRLDRKYSHSSGEVHNNEEHETVAGPNETNISQSQSESALKNKLVSLTSPVASATKDLVLSPFNKLAKGVQTLGANLDPRKMSAGVVRHVSEREYEEHRKLQEKWRGCKTRLIAL